MNAEKVNIDKIVNTNPYLDRKKIESIKRTLRKDGCLEYIHPLECNKKKGIYFITDGRHRFYAIKESGYDEVWVMVNGF
jgi:hypothetical protein